MKENETSNEVEENSTTNRTSNQRIFLRNGDNVNHHQMDHINVSGVKIFILKLNMLISLVLLLIWNFYEAKLIMFRITIIYRKTDKSLRWNWHNYEPKVWTKKKPSLMKTLSEIKQSYAYMFQWKISHSPQFFSLNLNWKNVLRMTKFLFGICFQILKNNNNKIK